MPEKLLEGIKNNKALGLVFVMLIVVLSNQYSDYTQSEIYDAERTFTPVGNVTMRDYYSVNNPKGIMNVGSDGINGTGWEINGSGSAIVVDVDTGQGATEVYPMDQAVQTTDWPTFHNITATLKAVAAEFVIGANVLDTNEWAFLDGVNQALAQASSVVFATVDTGQGANELYAMDQNVQTTDQPTFHNITATIKATAAEFVIGGNTLDTNEWAFLDGQNQAVATGSNVQFLSLNINDLFNVSNAGLATMGANLEIGGGFAGGGITAQTNGDILLAGSLTFSGDINIVDTFLLNGSQYPETTATYDLGNSTLQWRHGQFSGAVTATSYVIGANTLDTNEWAFLDGQNQAVASGSSVEFAAITQGGQTVLDQSDVLGDGNISNTITASNYLPLAGGTTTGATTLGNGDDIITINAGTAAYNVNADGFSWDLDTDADEGIDITRNVAATVSLFSVFDDHVDTTASTFTVTSNMDATSDNSMAVFNSRSATFDEHTVLIDRDTTTGATGKNALRIDSEDTDAAAVYITSAVDNTGAAVYDKVAFSVVVEGVGSAGRFERNVAGTTATLFTIFDEHADSTGKTLHVLSAQDASSTDTMVKFEITNALYNQPAVTIENDGAEAGLFIDMDTNFSSFTNDRAMFNVHGGAWAAFQVRKLAVGGDADRIGFILKDGTDTTSYFWIDDSGILYTKVGSAPGNDQDGAAVGAGL